MNIWNAELSCMGVAHSQAHEALIQPFAFCYEPGVTIKKWKWNQQQALKLFTVFVDNKK